MTISQSRPSPSRCRCFQSKLESYRDLQNAGKELNADQKTAVAKYNEVTQTLEFARDIYKQFLGIAVVSEKEAKKQAKKEAAAKNQAELARLREILLVQDALNQMGNEAVREDFLHGKNGAAQLTESELK
jgi:caprin-1